MGVHQPVHGDVVALGDFVVIEIVGAGDLNRAGAKRGIGILVGDDGDQPAMFLRTDGNLTQFAHYGGIAFIRRMHSHRAVAEHGFRARGGDGNIVARFAQGDISVRVFFDVFVGFSVLERVLKVPHMAGPLDILDLEVRNRGLKLRIPIDQALGAIDQPFIVQIDENLAHGGR